MCACHLTLILSKTALENREERIWEWGPPSPMKSLPRTLLLPLGNSYAGSVQTICPYMYFFLDTSGRTAIMETLRRRMDENPRKNSTPHLLACLQNKIYVQLLGSQKITNELYKNKTIYYWDAKDKERMLVSRPCSGPNCEVTMVAGGVFTVNPMCRSLPGLPPCSPWSHIVSSLLGPKW